MRRVSVELIVGSFVVIALVLFAYFTMRIGSLDALGGSGYELTARFADAGSLKKGAAVVIAGVPIGRVRQITLENYQANVVLGISGDVKIQEDAIATVKTRGLLGDALVDISPGGSEVHLAPGQQIRETEPALDLYALVAKYIFSQQSGGGIK